MRTPTGVLKAPPYVTKGGKKEVTDPSKAQILPLDYSPAICRQNEQGTRALSDQALQKQLASQLKLSAKAIQEAEKACESGESTFKHVFGSYDTQGKWAPTSAKGTLEDTEVLGSSFEQIDVGERGFYVALDKNYIKIFVVFGTGLKLIYGDQVGEYIEKAMCWNIEEYNSVNPPEIPKDIQHKEYEKWLLSNPHLCWAPWSRAGVYHWGVWMERGHHDRGSIVTKDTNVKARMEQVMWPLFKAMGALTRAQRILLTAVDIECMREYESILRNCLTATQQLFETDERECFTLRACLVNIFTEPHIDGGDVKGG
ncbi:hypothetical protein L873DRAFT_1848347 [Choiromyces venosus 120613-1]|uniref:Uncharacterized protein n=1 Tax=Choiromyces venosus 120613-1 TaxID=1336337 RepID=A0A3N4IZJ7_9PEZI|nr:hypothetical protein L873DRAFT_1848347 [Choiromyces venosus 120613-1]